MIRLLAKLFLIFFSRNSMCYDKRVKEKCSFCEKSFYVYHNIYNSGHSGGSCECQEAIDRSFV